MTEALLDALSLKVGSCYDDRGSSTDSDDDSEDKMCLSVESGFDDLGGRSDSDEDKMCLTVEGSSNDESPETDCVAFDQVAPKKKVKKSVSFDLDKNSETFYFPSEALSPKKSPEKSDSFISSGIKLGNPQVRLTPIDPSMFSSLRSASAESVRCSRQGDSIKLSPRREEIRLKANEIIAGWARSSRLRRELLELDNISSAEKLVPKTVVVKANTASLSVKNGLKGSVSSDLKTKSKLAAKDSPADKTTGNTSKFRQINVILKVESKGAKVADKGEVLKNRTESKSQSDASKDDEGDEESDHDNLCIDLKPHEFKIAESLSGTHKTTPSKSDNASANEGPSAITKPISAKVSSPVKPAKPTKTNDSVKNESAKKATNSKEKSVSEPGPKSSANENKLTLYGESDKTVSVITVRLLCMKCVQAARKDTPSKSSPVNQIVVKDEDCEVCKPKLKSVFKTAIKEEKPGSGVKAASASGAPSNLEKTIESVARNICGIKPEIKDSKSNNKTSSEALIQEALKNVVNTNDSEVPSLDGNVIIVKSSTGLTSTKSVLSKSNSIIIKDNAMKNAIRNASKNLKPSGLTTLDGKLYKVIFLPKTSALSTSSTIICSRTVKNPVPKTEKTEMVVSSVDSTHAPLSAAEVSSLNSLGSPCILTPEQLSSTVASTPNLQKVTPTPPTTVSTTTTSAANRAIVSPAKLFDPTTPLSNIATSCPPKTTAVTSTSSPVHTCGPLNATPTTQSHPARTAAVTSSLSSASHLQPSKTTTSSIPNVPISHPAKTVSSTSSLASVGVSQASKTNPTSSLLNVPTSHPPKSGSLTKISITSSLTGFNVLASNSSKSTPSSSSVPSKTSSSSNVPTSHPLTKTAPTTSLLSSVPVTQPSKTATASVPPNNLIAHPPKTTPITSNGTAASYSVKNNPSSPLPIPKILADKFKSKTDPPTYIKTFFGQRVKLDAPKASSPASPDSSSSFIALQDYLAQGGGKSIGSSVGASTSSPPTKFGEIKIPVNFDSSKMPCAALMRPSSVISLKSGLDRNGVAVSAEGVRPVAAKRARISHVDHEKSSHNIFLDADAKKSIIDAVLMPPFTPAVPDSVYDTFTPSSKFKCPQCPNTFLAAEHLQNHLNRRSAMLKYDCPACRNPIIFYNRCMLKQHCEKQHAAEVDLNCLTIDVLPLSLFDVSHFGCAKTGDLAKMTLDVAKKTVDAINSASAANVTSAVKTAVSKTVKKQSKSKPSAKVSADIALTLPDETTAPSRLLDLAQDWDAATSGTAQDFNEDFNAPPSVAKPAKKRSSRGKTVEISPDTLTRCRECQAEVPSLRAHLQASGKPNPAFMCECKKVCTSACSLKAHIRWHNKTPPHSCPECGEVLNSASLLGEHFKQTCYHSFKRNSFACRKCRQNFSSQSKVEGHILKNHTHQVTICGLCNFSNSDSAIISSHMKVKHAESAGRPAFRILRFMTCDFCPETRFPRHLSQLHVQQHITRNYFYHCSFCSDFKTVSRVDFGQHLDYCLFSTSLRSLENEPDEMDLSFSEDEDDPPASNFKDKYKSSSNGDRAKAYSKTKSLNTSDEATPFANLNVETKKPFFSVDKATPTSDLKGNLSAKAKPTLNVEATPALELKGNPETKLKSVASLDKTTPTSSLKGNFVAKAKPTLDEATPAVELNGNPETKLKSVASLDKTTPTSSLKGNFKAKSQPTPIVNPKGKFENKSRPTVNPKSSFEVKSKPTPNVDKATPASVSKDNFESKSKPPSSFDTDMSETSDFDLQDDLEAESDLLLGDHAATPPLDSESNREPESKVSLSCDKVTPVSDSKGSSEAKVKLSNGTNAAPTPNVAGSGKFKPKSSLNSDKAIPHLSSSNSFQALLNSSLSPEDAAKALDAIRSYENTLKLSRKADKPVQSLDSKIVKTDLKLSLNEHEESSAVDSEDKDKMKSKSSRSEEEELGTTPKFESESKSTHSDDEGLPTVDSKLGFKDNSKLSFNASKVTPARDAKGNSKAKKSALSTDEGKSAFGTTHVSETIMEITLSDDEAAPTLPKTNAKLSLNDDKTPAVDSEGGKTKSKSALSASKAAVVLDALRNLETQSKLSRSDDKSAGTSDSLVLDALRNLETQSKLSRSDDKSAGISDSKLDSKTNSKVSLINDKAKSTLDLKGERETNLDPSHNEEQTVSARDTTRNFEMKSKLSRSDEKTAATVDLKRDSKTNSKLSLGGGKAKPTHDLKSSLKSKLMTLRNQDKVVSAPDKTPNSEPKSKLSHNDKAVAHDSKRNLKLNRKSSPNDDKKPPANSDNALPSGDKKPANSDSVGKTVDSLKPLTDPKKIDNNLGALKETRKPSGETVNQNVRDSSGPGSFKQAISLADHMLNTQPAVLNANLFKLFSKAAKIMQCKYCPEQFESTVAAYTHLKSEHINLISKSSALNQTLKRKNAQPPAHVKSKIMKSIDSNQKSVENDSGSHKCSKCNFVGPTYEDLYNHMETHKTIYECPRCNESFVARPSLEKHLIVIHQFEAKRARSFVDQNSACSEVVKENGAYHARQGFYQCATCYKNFTSEESFNTHFRTHGLAFVNDSASPIK